MIISLTGFMGCGKSSVGRRLSELLCCRFVDLDEVIEGHECRTIPEIFAEKGEAGFRAIESRMLGMIMDEYSCSTDVNLVLSLGGGTLMTPECAKLVNEHTYCIYLRATVDTLVKNLEGEAAGRPMLQSALPVSGSSGASETSFDSEPTIVRALRTRITDLMGVRSSVYESVAHKIVDTDGKTLEEIALTCTSVGK